MKKKREASRSKVIADVGAMRSQRRPSQAWWRREVPMEAQMARTMRQPTAMMANQRRAAWTWVGFACARV
jgi:hypothetical protein